MAIVAAPSSGRSGSDLPDRLSAAEIIDRLELAPLPLEGGFFRQYFLSETGQGNERFTSAIYYLITEDSFSALHRLEGSELWLFHQGDAATQLCLFGDGSWEERTFGPDMKQGHMQSGLVDPLVWQGMRLAPGGTYALFSCVVTPAFDHEIFEMGDLESLISDYPNLSSRIRKYWHAP